MSVIGDYRPFIIGIRWFYAVEVDHHDVSNILTWQQQADSGALPFIDIHMMPISW